MKKYVTGTLWIRNRPRPRPRRNRPSFDRIGIKFGTSHNLYRF